MTVEFLAPNPWQSITPAVSRRKGRVTAAIAYVGDAAGEHLPLKRGDVLVCNCSADAIAARATSPDVLRSYMDAGVNVYRNDILHAKVIVAGISVWTGSANASDNSAKRLDEVVVRVVDRDVAADATAFIESLCSERARLTYADIDALVKIPRTRRQGAELLDKRVRPRPLELPGREDQVYLCSTEPWDLDEETVRVVTEERPSYRKQLRREHVYAKEDFFWWVDGEEDYRPGTWIVFFDDEEVWAPRQVVGYTHRDPVHLGWVYSLPDVVESIPRAEMVGIKKFRNRRLNAAEIEFLSELFAKS